MINKTIKNKVKWIGPNIDDLDFLRGNEGGIGNFSLYQIDS